MSSETTQLDPYTVPDWECNTNIPRKTLEKSTVHGWDQCDHKAFSLRSPTYLKNKVKEPSKSPVFRALGLNTVETHDKTPLVHAMSCVPELIEYTNQYQEVFQEYFIVNFQLPTLASFVMLFGRVRHEDDCPESFNQCWQQFLDGDDEYRTNRFKFIPNIVDGGSWLVSAAVNQLGGSRPTIIARKLTCSFHRGPNYMEVDISISSSYVANSLWGLFQTNASWMVVDMAFLIEALTDAELPELLLGCTRLMKMHLASTSPLKLTPESVARATELIQQQAAVVDSQQTKDAQPQLIEDSRDSGEGQSSRRSSVVSVTETSTSTSTTIIAEVEDVNGSTSRLYYHEESTTITTGIEQLGLSDNDDDDDIFYDAQ